MSHLLIDALHGRPTPRRPLWLMRQAGRTLPEYRQLRERYAFAQLCARADLAAEVTLMPLRRFPLDAAIVFADLMSPIAALGVEVSFAPGPVVSEPLVTEQRVRALPPVPPAERIAPEVTETIRRVVAELGGRVPVLGFAGGPWSIAAYLVQGQGRRGFPALRAMARARPKLLGELLEHLARLCGEYLLAQARAGAAAVQVFETWSGLLSAADWRRLVAPHLRTLLERAGEAGVPRILFLQDAPHLVEAAAELPAEALAVDWRVDLPTLRRRPGPDRPLQGNLDPALLLAGAEATARAAAALLARMPARGHIVNLGHGLLPDTPLESIEALVRTVHEEACLPAAAATDKETTRA